MATYNPSDKQTGRSKIERIPVKFESTEAPLPKPDWIRIRLGNPDKVNSLRSLLRDNHLVTVCQEASCPNLQECYAHGTASFMIMGEKCTRRCTFCDVGHGRPDPLDQDEPKNLAETVRTMQLKYVVITSVDRDDLRDGGAGHYRDCINAIRALCPDIKIEILIPDFRGRLEKAFNLLADGLPDVLNHNIETVPRIYKQTRVGADYQWSLTLMQTFKERFMGIPTKSGLMLGLGETNDEVKAVLHDLRKHDVDMLTLGQYLQPTKHHIPVARYVHPEEFIELGNYAKKLGFTHVASGPLVRSSYHADKQAAGDLVS